MAALLSAIFVFTSCLNSDNEVTTYYGDTAITSFSVGTLKYYKHTTSSTGKDSVYQTTLSCSGYKFYIDQAKREIYNPDSLPYGIDGTKNWLQKIKRINKKNDRKKRVYLDGYARFYYVKIFL